jgi:hypothetical protein
MRINHLKLAVLGLGLAVLTFSSCKKNESGDDLTSASDHTVVTQHLNASIDDAANAAGGVGNLSGKTDGAYSLQGATIDSSQKASGILTINYDGTTIVDGCFKRSGSVTLTLENYTSGTRWKDMGAVLDISLNALKITNTITGATYQYDGLHHITNVSGRLAWRILAGLDAGTVVHRHTATGATITFSDGSQRTWNVNRLRTYTNAGGVISMGLSSDNTIDGLRNVDAWGTTRKGESFHNQILDPIVFNNSCGNYRQPKSGEDKISVATRSLDVLLGTDQNGTPVTGSCPWGYKVTYTVNNRVYTKVIQYWH